MKKLYFLLLLFSGMMNAQIVNIPDANFKAELVQYFDLNLDGEIQVTEALYVTNMTIQDQSATTPITSLEGISSFTNVTNLHLGNMPQLTSFDLSGLTNLTSLSIGGFPWTTLDLSNLPPSVTGVELVGMSLTSFTMAGNTSIMYLTIQSNASIGALNLSGCTALYRLNLDNASLASELVFNSVNLTGCSALNELIIYKTSLTNLDVSGCTALVRFWEEDNHMQNLDFSGLTHLEELHAGSNMGNTNLVSVNANGCTSLNNLNVAWNDHLQSVYFKNGVNEAYVYLQSCPALAFVCVDDSQVAAIQTQLNNLGMSTVVCSSYCSFTPGGNYNTISGNITFDSNSDGCDAGDLTQPNIRMNINDGTTQGATFTDTIGSYPFYTQAGSFAITPAIENPAWFNFSPPTATIPFADNNNNTVNQNFCITANGVHPDVEVIVAPITPARPGFNAVYQITYKNKGNQTVNGVNTFAYDDTKMDFVSATQNPDLQEIGTLYWDFGVLQPFESRSLTVTLYIHAPTDSTPVNIGDQLVFNHSITTNPSDENIADNTFQFHQTVVGSFDPNDITCIEGNVVPPAEIGNYLHYVINFENTGTADAQNIVVKDIIDTTQFDVNSLQILNSSAPVTAKLTGNVAEFIFQNINLHSGGHGNILIKVKSKNTLVQGDTVSKRANIYFDYNAPVDTNPENTTFQALSNPDFEADASISVYPNPTKGNVNISCNNNIHSVQIYDVQGRLLQTSLVNENQTTIDISNQSNGIYFLKVLSDKGTLVQKIIKE